MYNKKKIYIYCWTNIQTINSKENSYVIIYQIINKTDK